MAHPATPGTIDGHGVAFPQAAHALPDFRNIAGVFMSQGERAGNDAFIDDMQIGMANACAGNPQEYLARARHRLGNVHDFRRAARLDKTNSSHL